MKHIDSLERRALFAATYPVTINFQPAASAVPGGTIPDGGAVYADRGNGYAYGWNTDSSADAIERPPSRVVTRSEIRRVAGSEVTVLWLNVQRGARLVAYWQDGDAMSATYSTDGTAELEVFLDFVAWARR